MFMNLWKSIDPRYYAVFGIKFQFNLVIKIRLFNSFGDSLIESLNVEWMRKKNGPRLNNNITHKIRKNTFILYK